MKFYKHFDIATGREYVMAMEENKVVAKEIIQSLFHPDIFISDNPEQKMKNHELCETYRLGVCQELHDKLKGSI